MVKMSFHNLVLTSHQLSRQSQQMEIMVSQMYHNSLKMKVCVLINFLIYIFVCIFWFMHPLCNIEAWYLDLLFTDILGYILGLTD